jgi:hypothetical protein
MAWFEAAEGLRRRRGPEWPEAIARRRDRLRVTQRQTLQHILGFLMFLKEPNELPPAVHNPSEVCAFANTACALAHRQRAMRLPHCAA